jgi:hypothetical protein
MTRSKAARHCLYKARSPARAGEFCFSVIISSKEGSAHLVPELALAHPTGSSSPILGRMKGPSQQWVLTGAFGLQVSQDQSPDGGSLATT